MPICFFCLQTPNTVKINRNMLGDDKIRKLFYLIFDELCSLTKFFSLDIILSIIPLFLYLIQVL
jgi:hypothetical protein